MIVYHEAEPGSLQSLLVEGMKRTSRGEKGDEPAIMRADTFLDSYRPPELVRAGVSRDDNLYAYLSDGGSVIDIISGEAVGLGEFVEAAEGVILKIAVDDNRCFVSDLDMYDRVKQAIESGEESEDLARRYWDRLVPLDDYKPGQIRRPEVMIPYDVPPEKIQPVNQINE